MFIKRPAEAMRVRVAATCSPRAYSKRFCVRNRDFRTVSQFLWVSSDRSVVKMRNCGWFLTRICPEIAVSDTLLRVLYKYNMQFLYAITHGREP